MVDLNTTYKLALAHPDSRAAFALVGLTGLSVEQSTQAELNLAGHYAQVGDAVYPMSEQAIALLDGVSLADSDVQKGLTALDTDEDTLRDALSAAIWATSDDGTLLQEMVSLPTLTQMPLSMTYPFSIVEQLDPADTGRFEHSRATVQAAVDYMLTPQSKFQALLAKLLDGKLVFLVVTTGVSGLNLIHNLVMGRLLNPVDYGQLTFINTLLLIIGLIPSGIQTVSSRYSSIYEAQGNGVLMASLWRFWQRFGWLVGAVIAMIIVLLAPFFVEWFQLRDAWIVYPIAFGIPFYLAFGIDRGLLQGKERYYWLSGAYLVEGIIRLGLGVVLTMALASANRGVDGAIWALAQSLVLAWFVSWLSLYSRSPIATDDTNSMSSAEENKDETVSAERTVWLSLFGYTSMALLGQALITNSDFVLVKTYFDAYDAGLYAAISVIGRIVYFGTLPLTVLIVPLVAREQSQGKSTRNLFLLLMGSGVVLCGGLVLVSALFAPQIVQLLYGAEYVAAAGLLPLYTVAAALFVLTNLLVTYRVALGKGSETWMPLLAAIAQIIGVILFHDTLMTIIIVQISIMSVLFAGVAWRSRK
ncbi:MAG: hypothetical protein AAFR81_16010 [Chloroflexota bacterium]